MAQFLPFIDKENSSQLGVLRPVSHGSGPVGKNFSAEQSLLSSLGFAVRRKALGSLNVNPSNQQQTRPTASKIPVRDFTKQMPKQTLKPEECVAPPVVEEEKYPEIEIMPEYEEPEDTYSDLWDPVERPDSYIDEMLRWRPARCFPCRPGLDDSDDSLIMEEGQTDLLDFHVKDDTVEDIELVWEKDEDVIMPPLILLDELDTEHYDNLPSFS